MQAWIGGECEGQYLLTSQRKWAMVPFLRRVFTLWAQFRPIHTCSGQMNLYWGEIAVLTLGSLYPTEVRQLKQHYVDEKDGFTKRSENTQSPNCWAFLSPPPLSLSRTFSCPSPQESTFLRRTWKHSREMPNGLRLCVFRSLILFVSPKNLFTKRANISRNHCKTCWSFLPGISKGGQWMTKEGCMYGASKSASLSLLPKSLAFSGKSWRPVGRWLSLLIVIYQWAISAHHGECGGGGGGGSYFSEYLARRSSIPWGQVGQLRTLGEKIPEQPFSNCSLEL